MFKLLTKRALIALTFVVCVGSGFGLWAGKPGGNWQKRCYGQGDVLCTDPKACLPKAVVSCDNISGDVGEVRVPDCGEVGDIGVFTDNEDDGEVRGFVLVCVKVDEFQRNYEYLLKDKNLNE